MRTPASESKSHKSGIASKRNTPGERDPARLPYAYKNEGQPPARQSVDELRELQRKTFAAISHPLDSHGETQSRFRDGRPMEEVASEFIKPNDRLTSLERLSIYNRQYWFRLMDCLWDDYPGLRALLGHQKFERLRIAYLERYPSHSFTLRNLGSRLFQFLQEEPALTSPIQGMCLDMARFEWAQVVAFDGLAKPPLSVDDLLGHDPENLRLGLQPYMSILEMDYPLDDFVLALKKRDEAMRSEASNAIETTEAKPHPRRAKRPARKKVFLAVHRHENDLYYKRLAPAEHEILKSLQDGCTLAEACAAGIALDPDAKVDWGMQIQTWFSAWAEIGWFCKR